MTPLSKTDALPSQELAFALDICREAGDIAMRYFQRGVEAHLKSDGSPVTRADQESERLIREAIAYQFPHDGILGEEEGETFGADAEINVGATPCVIPKSEGMNVSLTKRRWIIDPIDGTYGFARGVPIFATLLALEENGEIRLGIVHAPAMSETYWAEKGYGAYRNGERIAVSDCALMSQAQFNFGCPERILSFGYWEGLTRMVKNTYRQRAFGDYLGFAYVFDGKAEANIEIGVRPWDLAPMKILIEEAGGMYSDLKGGRSIYTGSCLVSNAKLHSEFLNTLLSANSQ